MNKKLLVFVMMSVMGLLAACGKSGPSTQLSLTMTDFAFEPNEFEVPAGQEITLNVMHHGTMEHDFIIMKYGTDAGDIFDDEDKANIFWEVALQPGDSETVYFSAPTQPGTYQIICGMPGHLQSGMIGKLIVTEAP
jgi:uncharacterized cupredoxin-like copper-binding protein